MKAIEEQQQASALTPLSDREYRLMRDLVYDKFGINLGEQKRALITGRLQKVLKENGFGNFSEYYDYVNSDQSGQALTTLINRISTNHTFFYREKDHFEYFLETVLPQVAAQARQQGQKKLHLWCPGCSSGEEPYTLAMLLLEYLGRESDFWDAGILATDISSRVLEKAQAGSYSPESIAHLPRTYVLKYFERESTDSYQVSASLQKLVLFRRLNLMRKDYPFKGKFQVIFCRNVMIYFDQPTRTELVHRFHRYLAPEGYLFIGHSESLGRSDAHFKYIRPAVYQKV